MPIYAYTIAIDKRKHLKPGSGLAAVQVRDDRGHMEGIRMKEVKRIYNIAESIITITGEEVERLDIQHFTDGYGIEGYCGYLKTKSGIEYRIRPDGTFETIIKRGVA